MNLPNKLTMLRVLLVPVFVATFYLPWRSAFIFTALLFAGAFVTDMIDGHIARKYKLVTDFGKLMDPIADKLLTAAALIMLSSAGALSPIVTIAIIAREFIVSGLRLVVADKGVVVAANGLGKAKTVSQFVMILLLILMPALRFFFGGAAGPIASIAVWVALILTVWSGAVYVASYWPYIDYRK